MNIPDASISPDTCPIAYDHTDDIDECAVCGWGAPTVKPLPSSPRDMLNMTGPERIQEAIDRLSGAYAPTRRITICGPDPYRKEGA